MLRFLTDSSAQASFHVSQFLGTGVVRAYKTERCGIPGLRILLHPDLEPLLDKDAMRIIPAKPSEKMRLIVRSEVNYLDPKTDTHLGPDYDDCLQFDALRWMLNAADEAFHYHYIETFHAWNAMRAQLGRAPYPWEKFLDRDEYDYSHGIRTRPDAKERTAMSAAKLTRIVWVLDFRSQSVSHRAGTTSASVKAICQTVSSTMA